MPYFSTTKASVVYMRVLSVGTYVRKVSVCVSTHLTVSAILRTSVRELYSKYKGHDVCIAVAVIQKNKRDIMINDMDETNGHQGNITDILKKVCSEPRTVTDKERDIAQYILEKSLRIASVTLKLTSLMDTYISLRSQLEKTSMRLVELSASAQTSMQARTALLTQLRTLVGLFATAQLSGVMSYKNTSIMISELVGLADMVAEVEWVHVRRAVEETAFNVTTGDAFYAQESYTGPSKTSNGYARRTTSPASTQRVASIEKDTTSFEGSNMHTPPKPHVERVQEIQKDRRATILGLLQRKDRVTVRDVAQVIKDCSEKTLQRELLALVRQGVLVKEGERRWSTYRLA